MRRSRLHFVDVENLVAGENGPEHAYFCCKVTMYVLVKCLGYPHDSGLALCGAASGSEDTLPLYVTLLCTLYNTEFFQLWSLTPCWKLLVELE